MNEQKVCGFCHANEDGEYDMFGFEHPADPQRSAAISFCNGILAVEIEQPGDEHIQRLSCAIRFCPLCGREYEARKDANEPDEGSCSE